MSNVIDIKAARIPSTSSHQRSTTFYQRVCDYFMSTTQIPSSMGVQLQRMQEGVYCDPAPHLVTDRLHNQMLENAPVFRCVSTLSATEVLHFGDFKHIAKHAKACHMTEGGIVVGVLSAYYKWDTYSKERALAEVYVWAKSQIREDRTDGKELAESFRVNGAKRARTFACNLSSDAFAALGEWVAVWNRRQTRFGNDV